MLELSRKVLNGDRVAVSRAISCIEDREKDRSQLIKEIFPHTGSSFIIGVTGPPGTGKSSIVDRLVKIYKDRKDNKIAVLAIDPTSPLSGGAILGDRVRMLTHALDPRVYIRSMASRGDEGGLSLAARDATRILDAAGYSIIFLETVGTGQAEVDIVKVADLVIVVLMPELGDEVQAAKAGLMEIGEIFIVNKSDLPGADKVLYNLNPVLGIKAGWRQIAVKISASTGEGFNKLVEAIDEYRGFYNRSSNVEERKLLAAEEELLQNVSTLIEERVKEELRGSKELKLIARNLVAKKIDPHKATKLLLEEKRIIFSHLPKSEKIGRAEK